MSIENSSEYVIKIVFFLTMGYSCYIFLCPKILFISVYMYIYVIYSAEVGINPLNVELNPICYLLALLEAHHILHDSRIRVKVRIR